MTMTTANKDGMTLKQRLQAKRDRMKDQTPNAKALRASKTARARSIAKQIKISREVK